MLVGGRLGLLATGREGAAEAAAAVLALPEAGTVAPTSVADEAAVGAVSASGRLRPSCPCNCGCEECG